MHYQDRKPSWGLLDLREMTLAGQDGRAWVYPTRKEARDVLALYDKDGRYKPVKLTVKYERA